MFIDVTHGGDGRILRLSTSAIAYLDQAETGTRVRLIGGENLRIAESPAELEARIEAHLTTIVGVIDHTIDGQVLTPTEALDQPGTLPDAKAAAGRGKNK